MFFSIFAHKLIVDFLSLSVAVFKKNHYLCGDKREDG